MSSATSTSSTATVALTRRWRRDVDVPELGGGDVLCLQHFRRTRAQGVSACRAQFSLSVALTSRAATVAASPETRTRTPFRRFRCMIGPCPGARATRIGNEHAALSSRAALHGGLEGNLFACLEKRSNRYRNRVRRLDVPGRCWEIRPRGVRAPFTLETTRRITATSAPRIARR